MNINIQINGKTIELTDKQIQEITQSLGLNNVQLSEVPEGETFRIGEYEFIVLEQSGDTTAVILKELLHDNIQFGNNNNFNGSNVDKLCSDFATEITAEVGAHNLVEHTVDLTSDDGLKDYGKTKRRVSLLTAPQYRKYVEILDKYKLNKWWWLSTAFSTPTHDNANWIKCVSPHGGIYSYFYHCDCGVRPFLHFVSSISVSK
jgi:hypothetical protein